ncbi:hypothetical protein CRM22_007835 [Opisthorchis felineus]|uniref:SEC7 domain-containing protein n=3 Tax=Opisthorchis felineus TaxID=147828 RepID=A0A4S2LDX1_OPIFE|nr:hypothetical protein CRM22_007835 [Opisthorchis felineus]
MHQSRVLSTHSSQATCGTCVAINASDGQNSIRTFSPTCVQADQCNPSNSGNCDAYCSSHTSDGQLTHMSTIDTSSRTGTRHNLHCSSRPDNTPVQFNGVCHERSLFYGTGSFSEESGDKTLSESGLNEPSNCHQLSVSHQCSCNGQHVTQRQSPRTIKTGRHLSNNYSAYPDGNLIRAAIVDPRGAAGPLSTNSIIAPNSFTEVAPLSNIHPLRADFGNTSYELSEDLQAKEVELIERSYGGRLRAQRAARIIQTVYRDYRLRTEYARLCMENCSKRKIQDHDSIIPATGLHKTSPPSDRQTSVKLDLRRSENQSSRSSGSLEDLVLEQAYVDWALKAATEQLSCGISSNSDSTGAISFDRTSHTSGTSRSNDKALVEGNQVASSSCEGIVQDHCHAELCHGHETNFSVGSRLSNHRTGPNCSAIYPLVARDTNSNHTIPNSNFAQCNCLMRTTAAVLSCEIQRRRTSPIRKLSSPTLTRRSQPRFEQSCRDSVMPSSQRSHSGLKGSSTTPGLLSSQGDCHSVPVPNKSSDPSLSASPCLSQQGSCVCQCSKCSRSNGVCTHPAGPFSADHINSFTAINGKRPVLTNGVAPDASRLSSRTCSRHATHHPSSHNSSSASGCHNTSRPVLVALPTSVAYCSSSGHSWNSSTLAQHQLTGLAIEQMKHTHLFVPTQCRASHAPQQSLTRVLPSDGQHSVPSPQPLPLQIIKQQARNAEKRRKRIYRIGLNMFNKSAVKGIDFLVKCGFLDCSPETIARFLLTRKGLSRVAIGDYLGNTKDELAMATTRQFMRELDFRELEVDEALRLLLSCFRTPGESQKIVHLLTEFQSAYIEQNPARVKAQFRNIDSVMVLAYAVVMLHTDMYSPNVRPQSKMTRDEFVRNLRGVDGGEDLDRNLLLAIYDRIRLREMSVAPDHTDQVRKIQQHLTGPLRPINLALPQRRLVCYCRLYEVPDKHKKERCGAHQREVFLFNDLLLITKAVQKKRRDAAIAYQVRLSLNLLGVRILAFETMHHPNGLELVLPLSQHVSINAKESGLTGTSLTPDGRARILVTLNTKTASDRVRFMEDLHECILEVTEADRVRIDEEMAKQVIQRKRFIKQGSVTVGCAGLGAGGGGSGAGCPAVNKALDERRMRTTLNSTIRQGHPVETVHSSGERQASMPPFVTSQQQFNQQHKQQPHQHPGVVLTSFSRHAVTHNQPPTNGSGLPNTSSTCVCKLNQSSRHGETITPRELAMRPEKLEARQAKVAGTPAEEAQRLSGDSGLLADLETPTSQTSHPLGSYSSGSSG